MTKYQAYELVQMKERSVLNIPAPGAIVYLAADVETRDDGLHVGLEQIIAMASPGSETARVVQRLLATLDQP